MRVDKARNNCLRHSHLFILCFLIAIGLFVSSCRGHFGSAEEESIKAQAKPIIEAIEKYKKDNGKYPENLSDLVPKYIPSIKNPNLGVKKWKYVRFFGDKRYAPNLRGEGYELTVFERDDSYECIFFTKYPSGKEIWYVDQ